MNQGQVKEQLKKLHEASAEYSLIFSGKKNKKVNGLYKPDSREIIIHNRNFINESALMFTAIHELTHHILNTELGQKGARAHSELFWSTFYDLIDKAESIGIYTLEIDDDTEKLIEEARDINKQIADLQRQLGELICRIHEVCLAKELRVEDVIARKIQVSKESAKIATIAYGMGDQGVGADIQQWAAKQKNVDKRDAILAAGREGKSVIQAKRSITKPPLQEDNTVFLIKEKRRIERTIESLTHRLEELNEQLEERSDEVDTSG